MTHIPKKTIFCGLFVLVAFAGVFSFSILAACPVEKTPCRDLRDPVLFPHEMHMGLYDCLECHHVYDEAGTNILDPMELYPGSPQAECTSCHVGSSRLNRRDAYHSQCIGCHSATTRIRSPGGPYLCGECHRKQDRRADAGMILGEPHD